MRRLKPGGIKPGRRIFDHTPLAMAHRYKLAVITSRRGETTRWHCARQKHAMDNPEAELQFKNDLHSMRRKSDTRRCNTYSEESTPQRSSHHQLHPSTKATTSKDASLKEKAIPQNPSQTRRKRERTKLECWQHQRKTQGRSMFDC